MRRRFGRRRGSEEPHAIDPRALERIVEQQLVPVTALETVGAEDVPASLAALGLGTREDGQRVAVGFTDGHAEGALFGVLALVLRLHEQSGFDGEAFAVAPRWDRTARRVLGRLRNLPIPVRAVEGPGLAEAAAVEPIRDAESVVPVEAVLRAAAGEDQRRLLERGVEALRGLAAKYGGAVRGYGQTVEIVFLARRVAVLRAEAGELVFEIKLARGGELRTASEDLPDALDRLEGAIRRHLSDRKTRDGEPGLRGRVLGCLAESGEIRDLVPWPLGGSDSEVIDFAAIDSDGMPLIGAARRTFTLGDLCGVARASETLEPLLPTVLRDAAPPVRVESPGLALCAVEFAAATRHVLRHWTGRMRCHEVVGAGSRKLSLRPLDLGRVPSEEPRESSGRDNRFDEPTPTPMPTPSEPPDAETRRADRPTAPRSRGGRGRGRRAASDRSPEAAAGDDSRGAARSGFEEVSLFDLGDDTGRSEEAGRRGRRRRGRSRRPRGSADADGEEKPARSAEGEASSETLPAPEGSPPGDTEPGSSEPRSRRRGRRRRTAPESTADAGKPAASESTVEDEEALVDADEDSLVQLADAPDFEAETPVVAYEDDDEDDGSSGKTPAVDSPKESDVVASEPRQPRRRVAIVAHADRDAVAAAVLLAREFRLVEGIWVYQQSELMTFFRSVATDLREDTPLYVVGFTPSPVRDVVQAASLYRDRLTWFDHHEWPPEDREQLQQAIGPQALNLLPASESSLAAVLGTCSRRSRFSDKLVELATSRFSQHDWERWGRLWWWRLGKIAAEGGERRADLEALLAGRPSDLAREASRAKVPPPPDEMKFAAERDFRLVHFGGYTLVIVPVPAELDLYLAARIVRDRYGARLSLAHHEGGSAELLVLGSDDGPNRRNLDLAAMVNHLAGKFSHVEALSGSDRVARVQIHGLFEHPERFEELVGEIAMGRSVLEG